MFFCGNVHYLLPFPIHYAMWNLINEAMFIFQIIGKKNFLTKYSTKVKILRSIVYHRI